MFKKILYLNITVISLIFAAATMAFYGSNYPTRFDFAYDFNDYELGYILLILIGIAIPASLVATLEIKNLDFKNKFFRIILLLNSLLLCFIIFEGLSGYLKNLKEVTEIENQYIKQAKNDIKNDKVTYRFAGGLELPMYGEKTNQKIDRIHQKYGIQFINTGCIVMPIYSDAQKKYELTVEPYLEKRNGKNWQAKMDKEIAEIKHAASQP